MNMQRRAEERSYALHRKIARRLKENPDLWDIPKENLAKWEKRSGKLSPAYIEWKNLLAKKDKRQILDILEDRSEEAIRLRSSSPFTGILDATERKKIFDQYHRRSKT
jgi:hypothetical protein